MQDAYWESISRNLGIISPAEQQKLRDSCVAIAGCGGMGGLAAVQLARIGVGHLKIADGGSFELSNLNRQFAAKISTLGKNKAECTYNEIKQIAPDIEVDVFTEGITAGNADYFVEGADIVCDEIDFFQVDARIFLHRAARRASVNVLNCNVIGFGTRIFLFTPQSMTMEELLAVDEHIEITDDVVCRLVQRLAPHLPPDISEKVFQEWIVEARRAPIFGGTPALSSGILVLRTCLQLLGNDNRAWIRPLPAMPGYAYFDAGTFESFIHTGTWW